MQFKLFIYLMFIFKVFQKCPKYKFGDTEIKFQFSSFYEDGRGGEGFCY